MRGLDLELAPGRCAAIQGRSGSGKTTLLRLVAGLEVPSAGAIAVDGEQVSGAGWARPPFDRGVGFLFQRDALWTHMSVLRNITFGLAGIPQAKAEARAAGLLERLGLAGMGDRAPATLSGGEARRVALARALAPRPRLLLLDEPLAFLDAELRADMLELLVRLLSGAEPDLVALDTSAVVVTHDPAVARAFALHRAAWRMVDGALEPVEAAFDG